MFRNWVPRPFGLDQQKPHHYLEMARVAWENRDQLPFAWRILRDGVCDGCALGTSGLRTGRCRARICAWCGSS